MEPSKASSQAFSSATPPNDKPKKAENPANVLRQLLEAAGEKFSPEALRLFAYWEMRLEEPVTFMGFPIVYDPNVPPDCFDVVDANGTRLRFANVTKR